MLQGWWPCFGRDLEGNSACLRPGALTLCSAGWRPAAVRKEPGRCHVGEGAGCAHGTDLWGSLDAPGITCGGQPTGMARLEASQEKAECPGTGKCLTAISCRPLLRQRAAGPSHLRLSLKREDRWLCGERTRTTTSRGMPWGATKDGVQRESKGPAPVNAPFFPAEGSSACSFSRH